MARSMRLGFDALSPHDLADESEGLEGESVDVTDPMVRFPPVRP